MPRNKHPEETRTKILDAAIKTFLEKGYEQTTILDIVSNMGGLTRGAFYHHFKSKEEVLNAISDKIFEDTNPIKSVLREKGLNAMQKLRKILIWSLGSFEGGYKELHIASLDLMKNPQFLAEQMNFNKISTEKYFQPLIQEGMKDGSIPVKNPRLAAELMLLMFNIWFAPPLFPGSEQYMLEKVMHIKTALDSIGIPVVNSEFLDAFDHAFRAEGHNIIKHYSKPE